MRSFTLIETLITIAIFTLAMGAVMDFIFLAWRAQSYAQEQAIAIGETRRAMEMLTKELREARQGDDGSFAIVRADDKEVIFYADIDKDDVAERVRYSLGTTGAVTPYSQSQPCVTFVDGGMCSVIFSDFITGLLTSAQLTVSLEGDFGWSQEYAEVSADGVLLDKLCKTGCSDCAGAWQGAKTFDIQTLASDNYLELSADSTNWVNAICDWQEPNHSMKVKFELNWEEEAITPVSEFQKGVIDPSGSPVQYLVENEQVLSLSSYVRNSDYVFKYFDEQGLEIVVPGERQKKTKLVRAYLLVDVNPNRTPPPFELESDVQLRNLKENQ